MKKNKKALVWDTLIKAILFLIVLAIMIILSIKIYNIIKSTGEQGEETGEEVGGILGNLKKIVGIESKEEPQTEEEKALDNMPDWQEIIVDVKKREDWADCDVDNEYLLVGKRDKCIKISTNSNIRNDKKACRCLSAAEALGYYLILYPGEKYSNLVSIWVYDDREDTILKSTKNKDVCHINLQTPYYTKCCNKITRQGPTSTVSSRVLNNIITIKESKSICFQLDKEYNGEKRIKLRVRKKQ